MIIVKVCEGLGNQLFQYAFARRLQKNGKNVFLDVSDYTDEKFPIRRTSTKRSYQLDHFNIKINKANERHLQRYRFLAQENWLASWISVLSEQRLWMYQVVVQEDAWEYKESYLNRKGNIYYKGWFQNSLYFSSIRKQLLKEITPNHKIHIQSGLKTLLQADNIVAVHCRRGDYKYIRNCLPIDYYKRAMKYMEQELGNPQYLFFSDDLPWVKAQFGNKENFIYMDDYGKYEDYEELMIMSRCKNIIMANSTFSWWAAWLNTYENKIVVMPKIWAYEKGKRIIEINSPLEWIRL